MGLLIYSRLLVQPSVTAKYRQRCEELLQSVSTVDKVDTVKETAVAIGEEDSTGTIAERYRLINVHLKRLAETTEHRRWAQYQLGLNAAAYSRLLSTMSMEAQRRGNQRKSLELQTQAYFEKKRASETMRILSRTDAPEANQARVWTVAESLGQSVRAFPKIEELSKIAESALQRSPSDETIIARIGQLEVMKGYSRSDQVDHASRDAALAKATELLSSVKNRDFVASSYLAEALDSKNPEAAKELSSRVAQSFWQLAAPDQRRPEILAAMLCNLIRLGSFSEAQGLMTSRIGTLSQQDAGDTLQLAADGLWRQLVGVVEYPLPAARLSTPSNLLDLLAQVEPRSVDLTEFIIAASEGKMEVAVDDRIRTAVESDESSPIRAYLLSFRAALSEDWQGSRAMLQSVSSVPPYLPIAFAAAASTIAERDPSKKSVTLHYHEQLTRVAPQSIQTWLERITFCIRSNENEKSLECLGFLREKADGNPILLETLAALYKRLGEDATAAQLRDQIIELNRTNTKQPAEGRR